MIEPDHSRLSIVRQCQLVSIARSAHYYAGKGESPLNLALMRLIDEQYLRTPWYGCGRWVVTCDDRGTASVASGLVA